MDSKAGGNGGDAAPGGGGTGSKMAAMGRLMRESMTRVSGRMSFDRGPQQDDRATHSSMGRGSDVHSRTSAASSAAAGEADSALGRLLKSGLGTKKGISLSGVSRRSLDMPRPNNDEATAAAGDAAPTP